MLFISILYIYRESGCRNLCFFINSNNNINNSTDDDDDDDIYVKDIDQAEKRRRLIIIKLVRYSERRTVLNITRRVKGKNFPLLAA